MTTNGNDEASPYGLPLTVGLPNRLEEDEDEDE